jgi:hypothetical protein
MDPLAPIRLGIRLGIAVLRFELDVLEHLLGLEEEPEVAPEPRRPVQDDAPRPRKRRRPAAARPAPVVPEPAADVPPRPEPVEPEPAPAEPIPESIAADVVEEALRAPGADEPVHIDTEPELVGEFSEQGAEEGAGAEIHVAEPWHGYGQMHAADVVDRVLVASPEELAVVQLYEGTHRKRHDIIEAVERRSRELANAPSGR